MNLSISLCLFPVVCCFILKVFAQQNNRQQKTDKEKWTNFQCMLEKNVYPKIVAMSNVLHMSFRSSSCQDWSVSIASSPYSQVVLLQDPKPQAVYQLLPTFLLQAPKPSKHCSALSHLF